MVRIPLAMFALLAFGVTGVTAQEKVFFGNLHGHSSYSDGLGLPGEAYDHAKGAKLDFFALTEHNHALAVGADHIGIGLDHTLYNGPGPNALIAIAKAKTVNGSFIALYGQEFSTISTGNHLNVLDVGEVITSESGRFDKLLEFLSTRKDSDGKPCILMMNHPSNTLDILPKEYGRDDFNGVQDFVKKMGAETRLIQIINGPGLTPGDGIPFAKPDEQAFLKFLNMGFRVAPTADQDNHQKNWGSATSARTAIIAPELTKKALLDAIRQRHVYATEDANLRIVMKVNGKLCGEILPVLPATTRLDITYDISDDDEPNAEYVIKVFGDSVGGNPAALVGSFPATKDSTGKVKGKIEDIVFSGLPQYYFFKVTQTDEDGSEDDAWTAPVWFQNDPLAIVATSNEDEGVATPGNDADEPDEHRPGGRLEALEQLSPLDRLPRRQGDQAREPRQRHRRPSREAPPPRLPEARHALSLGKSGGRSGGTSSTIQPSTRSRPDRAPS